LKGVKRKTPLLLEAGLFEFIILLAYPPPKTGIIMTTTATIITAVFLMPLFNLPFNIYED